MIPTGETWDEYKKNVDLTYYPEPELSTNDYLTSMVVGDREILHVNLLGGNPEGWDINWRVNGEVMQKGGIDFEFIPRENKDYHIDCLISNYGPDGDLWYEQQTKSFTVTAFLEPVVEIEGTVSVMSGKVFTLMVKTEGGHDGGWRLFWSKDGDEKEEWNNSKEIKDAIINNGTSVSTHTYKLRWVNYGYEDFPLRADEKMITVMVYPQAKIASIEGSLEAAVGGYTENVVIEADITGGYNADGAWTYVWKKDGKVLSGENDLTLVSTIDDNFGSDSKTIRYEFQAENRFDDDLWFSDTRTFEVIVFPNVNHHASEKTLGRKENDEFTFEVAPSGGNPSGWTYEWTSKGDGHVLSSESFFTSNASLVSGEEQTYSVKMINMFNGKVIYESHENFLLKVFDIPRILSESSNHIDRYSGQQVTLSVEKSGGDRDGWSFEWTQNGQRVGQNSASYTFTPTNTLLYGYEGEDIRVLVYNRYNGQEEWLKQTIQFDVRVYGVPNAEFVDKVDLYEGTLIDPLREWVNHYGGYDNGWEVTVSGPDGEVTGIFPVYANGRYLVKVTNTSEDGEKWFEETRSIDVNAYSRGTIGQLRSDSINIYAGGSVHLDLNVNGGYPGGWTFDWYEDNTLLTQTTTPEFDWTAGIPEGRENLRLSVRAKNQLGEITGADDMEDITLVVWPKAVYGEIIYPHHVREGNEIKMEVGEALNGYGLNGWIYRWTSNGTVVNQIGTQMSIKSSTSFSGQGKGTQELHYGLIVSNYGPLGNIWDVHDYGDLTVTVYRKPQTPTSLVRKGSGASGTLIATTDLTDSNLQDYDYYLVFGYYTGSSINRTYHDMTSLRQSEAGQVRWSTQIPTSIISDTGNMLYVYALWKYSDGVEITSGLRTLSGVDEEWDDSSYSGRTRAVIDGVSGIKEIVNDGVLVSTYLLSGQKSNHHDGQIVIRQCADGTVRKVFNK